MKRAGVAWQAANGTTATFGLTILVSRHLSSFATLASFFTYTSYIPRRLSIATPPFRSTVAQRLLASKKSLAPRCEKGKGEKWIWSRVRAVGASVLTAESFSYILIDFVFLFFPSFPIPVLNLVCVIPVAASLTLSHFSPVSSHSDGSIRHQQLFRWCRKGSIRKEREKEARGCVDRY